MTTIQQAEYEVPIKNADNPAVPGPAGQSQNGAAQPSPATTPPKPDPVVLTVLLAGRRYQIIRKPVKQASEWRNKFKETFGTVMGVFEIAQNASSADTFEDALKSINLGEAAEIFKNFVGLFINSMDTVLEMVYEYCPDMKADSDFIESHAYDEDIVDIFLKVLQIAYPAGKLAALINGAFRHGTVKK